MRRIIDLDGTWEMLLGREGDRDPASFPEAVAAGWQRTEAHVPGDVVLDLARSGIGPDPFFGENLYRYRKYEFHQWWLRKEFVAPAEPTPGSEAVLRVEGLNTCGTIWLNGTVIGETANMLVEHEFEVSRLVSWGAANEIVVRISSVMNVARNREFPVHLYGVEWHDEMVAVRMPAHSFGWDIMPRLISAGIWRSIGIFVRPPDHLTEVYYATRALDEAGADLVVRYRFRAVDPELSGYSIRLRGSCSESVFSRTVKATFTSGGFTVKIPSPKLWWPRGYGEANLYEVECSLLKDGSIVDVRTERIGLRTAAIERTYAEGERGEFRILINATPVMALGSNWVPLDACHSRDAERLPRAFELVKESGCNMLRCWGGNVYEDHAFFDLCDAQGVMVWQDFSFACGSYPQDESFLAVVADEAGRVVRKLRNHPSLLLWAGDNEVDQLFRHLGYRELHARTNEISREVLPKTVRDHDPYRPYLESSPCMPYSVDDDTTVPEQHAWGPRDYFKGEFYGHTTAHFISEIGYHGCPAVSSLERFIPAEQLWPMPNEAWDTHGTEYLRAERREYSRNQLMRDQVRVLFGHVPERLEDFVLASQVSQAEAMKFFVEMVRSSKWRRTGIIWWNLLDGWPQVSDAVVDYYFNRKLAYHFLRRVQVPVCLIVKEPRRWEYRCVVDNNTLLDQQVEWVIEDGDTGKVRAEGRTVARANENTFVARIPMIPGMRDFLVMRWKVGGTAFANHYIAGYPPMDFSQYRERLAVIESLPPEFHVIDCVR